MADISGGETFVDGQTVNASRLNNDLSSATILPAFVSAKPTTTPVTGDRALLYQASGGILIAPTLTDILNLQVKDGAAGVATMRSLGTNSNQAAPGNLVPYLSNNNTFTGTSNKFKHVSGTTGVTAAIAAGGGSTGTATLNARATDISGQITLTPNGTGITANSDQCTITFGAAFASAPNVSIVPDGANAWQAQVASGKEVTVGTITTTTFTLKSGATTALVAGTAYKFRYFVEGQ